MNKQPSQHAGFSPIVLLVIVVVGVVLVGGVFITVNKFMGGALPGAPALLGGAMRASEKDFEFVTDPLVRKNFVAQANQTSFRTSVQSSGKGDSPTVSEVELKGDTVNFRTIEKDTNGKEKSQMIMIGDTTYVKDYKDGKWWIEKPKVQPTSGVQVTTEETSLKPEDFKNELAKKKASEFKQLTREACGSLMCYKYQEIDPENNEGSRIFWFDDGKYLLRKEEYAFGEFKTTNEYSYDNISVSAPSPTKDVPPGKSIYEYIYSETGLPETGNQGELEQMRKDVRNIQKQLPQTNQDDSPEENTQFSDELSE
jgi:hypothetical protein